MLPLRSKNIDMLLTLTVMVLFAVFFYGVRVLIVALCTIICSLAADYLSLRANGTKRWKRNDFSPVITALIITCVLPASAPYWLAAAAAVISVAVAKLPFGGYGKNIFNPAAVAIAFVGISWPDHVFMYPMPFTDISLAPEISGGLTYGLSHMLSLGAVPRVDMLQAILGNYAGPAGTCVLLSLMCGIYMIVRGTINWQTVLTALASVSAIAAFMPRTTASMEMSLVTELFSGSLVFGIVFMASDPVTSPVTGWGKALYGLLLGVFTMLFRYFGQTEAGFIYALIFVNALAEKCDDWAGAVPPAFKSCLERLKRSENR